MEEAGSVAGSQCVPHVAVMDGAFPIPPANTGFLVLPSGHTQLQAFSGLFTLFCAQYVAPHIFPFDTLIFGMNGQTCDQAQPLMEQQTNTIQVPQCWRRNQVVLKTGRRFRFGRFSFIGASDGGGAPKFASELKVKLSCWFEMYSVFSSSFLFAHFTTRTVI